MSSLRTNREISSHQILDCLQVIGGMSNCLSLLTHVEDENTNHGEAKDSIEATLMTACHRLDLLLEDDARWKLPAVDGHDLHATAIGAQAQVLVENLGAVQLRNELVRAGIFSPAPEPKAPQKTKKKGPKKQ